MKLVGLQGRQFHNVEDTPLCRALRYPESRRKIRFKDNHRESVKRRTSDSSPNTSSTPNPFRAAPTISGGKPKTEKHEETFLETYSKKISHSHRCACCWTPGSSPLNPATNIAGWQDGFISKWIAPCGKTVAEPGAISIIAKRAPFSARKPARRVVLREKLISVARGWVCGVFIPHGPKKPMAIKTKRY